MPCALTWPPLTSLRQEACNRRIALELGQFLGARQPRLVARRIDHAEEAERLRFGGAELVPGHGRDVDEVIGVDGADLVADQALAAAPQDQHGMDMLVALERRIAAGRHLEIAQLAAE